MLFVVFSYAIIQLYDTCRFDLPSEMFTLIAHTMGHAFP